MSTFTSRGNSYYPVGEILSENIEPNNNKIEHKRQILKDLEDKYRRSRFYENRHT